MGSGIAALAASAGIPVVLLDVPGDGDRGSVARGGLQKAMKAKPASFMLADRAAMVRVGNIEDDLSLLAEHRERARRRSRILDDAERG